MVKNFKGINYESIFHGHLYWSAIPYTKASPLDIIEELEHRDNGDRICKILNKNDGILC